MMQGTPLIEAIEGDSAHYFVTFLWRDKGDTRNVVIWGGPAGLDHPEEHQMARLLASNLWYKTYQLQRDLRGVYTFSIIANSMAIITMFLIVARLRTD